MALSRPPARAPHFCGSSVQEASPVKSHRPCHPRVRPLARWPAQAARGITQMLSLSAGGRLCGARRNAQERTLSDVRLNSNLAFKASLEINVDCVMEWN